jgi:hypothetical protein
LVWKAVTKNKIVIPIGDSNSNSSSNTGVSKKKYFDSPCETDPLTPPV